MAKFNLEVNLDWLVEGEDGMSLDDVVKEQIIIAVQNKIAGPILQQISKQAEGVVNQRIQELVVEAIHNKIKTYLETPRLVTDSFGNVVHENYTVERMMEDRIRGLVDMKCLDDSGKFRSGGHEARYTIFDWLVKKHTDGLGKMIEEKVTAAMKATEKHIETLVVDRIKTQVADKLTNLIVENSTALALKTTEK